jgi:hypothetical protein
VKRDVSPTNTERSGADYGRDRDRDRARGGDSESVSGLGRRFTKSKATEEGEEFCK